MLTCLEDTDVDAVFTSGLIINLTISLRHDNLNHFGQYLAKGKLTQLSFYGKGERVKLSFCPMLFLMALYGH